jgi:alpha-1,2-mannosyltransferase
MSRRDSLARAARRILTPLLLGVLPALLIAFLVVGGAHGPDAFYDFHGDLYLAGRAILEGHDPYRAALLARLAAVATHGGRASTTFAVPVYPAPDLLLSVPLALIGPVPAGLLFAALNLAALAVGLRLLGVRDPRCLGAVLLGWPMLHTLRLGQVNGLLVLGLALVWRHRDHAGRSAIAAAATIAAKLFLWPVGVFMILSRRWASAVLAGLIAVVVVLAAWAALDFAGLAAYPAMLSHLSEVEATQGVSIPSLVAALGGSRPIGTAAEALVTAALLGAAWGSLRDPRSGGEERAFGLTVLASLSASPLVWPHYLVVLYVPIALASPSFGALWLLPLLSWVAPTELTHGDPVRIAIYLAIELGVAVGIARPLRAPAGRLPWTRERRANRPGGAGPVGRLAHGLESTSSR